MRRDEWFAILLEVDFDLEYSVLVDGWADLGHEVPPYNVLTPLTSQHCPVRQQPDHNTAMILSQYLGLLAACLLSLLITINTSQANPLLSDQDLVR